MYDEEPGQDYSRLLLTAAGQGGGNGVPVRNGLVAEYRFDECRNLLKYSQQFDNAAWTKTDCAITANSVAAPDGTTTADTVTLTVGAAQSIAATYAVTAATVYTYSIWVKLGTATAIKYAIYDLTNSADILAATSYGATTSWARYTYTFTTPAGCISISVRPVKDSAQDNATTAYLWGAQLEAGGSATTYVPTTDKQTLTDYSKPRKNLLLPNQANACEDNVATWFTKATAGDTVSASTTVAQQGTYSAKVICANAAASEGLYTEYIIGNLTPSTAYTASAYVYGSVAAETVKIGIAEYADDKTTLVGTTYANLTLGASWQRVEVTRTFGATGRSARIYVITQSQQACTMYVDGLQLEPGSAATAWEAPPNIGIVGSAVGNTTNDPTWTGNGQYFTTDDYCTLTGGNDAFSLSQYTIMAVFNPVSADADELILAKNSSNATGVGRTGFFFTLNSAGTGGMRLYQFDSDGAGTIHSVNTGETEAAWKVYTASCDGTKLYISKNTSSYTEGATTLTAAAPNTANIVYIGRYSHAAGSYFNGSIAYLAVWNRKLTLTEKNKCYAFLKSYLKRQRGISLP